MQVDDWLQAGMRLLRTSRFDYKYDSGEPYRETRPWTEVRHRGTEERAHVMGEAHEVPLSILCNLEPFVTGGKLVHAVQ